MSLTVKSVNSKLEAENTALRAEILQLKNDFNEKLDLQNKKIENLAAKLDLVDSTSLLRQNTIEILQDQISILRAKVDSQAQYDRRPNLRINGVVLPKKGESESNETVMKIVEDVCADLDVPLESNDIFRAHRVGKKKSDDDGRHHQAIIVRFRSWKTRCALYKARPTKQRPRKKKGPAPSGYRSISLDITRDRYALLDDAKELIETHFPDNDDADGKVFAYSDVNCNLAVRFGRKNVKYFSDKAQLDKIFAELRSPDDESISDREGDDQ